MNVYQFVLPDRSNDGLTDYSEARKAWEQAALANAGGFTYQGKVIGGWRDDRGREYVESSHSYQVAAEGAAVNELAAIAFEVFPDQKALFIAKLGVGYTVDRAWAPMREAA